MPRACTICQHPRREAIDRALVGGAALSETAALFRVSNDAVSRHKANHLPAKLVLAQEAEDVREALDVIKQLKAINAASLHILKEAREQGKQGTALAAIDRIHKQIELQAKLLGELDDVQGFAHVLGLLCSGHAGGQMVPGVSTHRRFRNVV